MDPPPDDDDGAAYHHDGDDHDDFGGLASRPLPPLSPSPSPSPSPALPGLSPSMRRWNHAVTAGLAIMALTCLLFVATDSESLLYYTLPPPAVPTESLRGGGRPLAPLYTTLSYAEEKEVTQRQPMCDYAQLVAAPEGVSWSPLSSSSSSSTQSPADSAAAAAAAGELAPRHAGCRLRAFDGAEGHAEALGCVAGRHLVFVGDSLSRYQYLSLAHFLEHGSWAEAEGGEEEEGVAGRSITYREGWGENWNDFYRLGSASFGGHEACDCFRVHGEKGHVPWAENRYYRRRRSSSDDQADVRVSFIGWFGDVGPRGHAVGNLTAVSQAALGCEPGACDAPHDWQGSIASFLRGAFLRDTLRPDVLLLNTGLWKAIGDGPQLRAVVAAAQALAAARSREGAPPEVYWKTTTSRAAGAKWVDDAAARGAFLDAGLRVFDASLFTQPLRDKEVYRDGTTHYTPEVYRGLNVLLLNEICGGASWR